MKYFLYLFLLAVIIPTGALSQIEEGDREIQATGSFMAMDNLSMLILSGTYGYYYSDRLQIGVGPVITHTEVFGFDTTSLGLKLFVRHNFTARDKLVPYVSGQWYQHDLSPDEPLDFLDLSFVQFGGGFKYFLNEYIAYDVSGNIGLSLGGGEANLLIVAGISAFL
ncbi:MAG: hypothetical protein GF417_04835 [Candidatus Latescibacteria bacterium]|nr:hypothetical protein [bacterium]MBD3423746.1 hypothetical protein [Candidatus Latescibacterota bacterium]